MPIKSKSPEERPQKYKSTAYYGSAQETYNAEPGDVWSIGEGRVMCGDMIKLDEAGIIKKHVGKVDVVYSDLPWTRGIYTRFYHIAGTEPTLPFDDFIEKMSRLVAKTCDGLVFLEMGVKQFELLKECVEYAGIRQLAELDCTYTEKRMPYKLYIGTTNNSELPLPISEIGRHSFQVITSITKAVVKPGTKYMDFCAGSMNFLQIALIYDAIVYGTEIIPRKFAEGLKNLMRGKYTPELIEKNVLP